MQIDVTQEHIDRCRAGAGHAIALAMNELTGREWFVGLHSVWELKPGSPVLTLPEVAGAFVEDFDNGVSVEPFTFTLEVPEP